MLWEERRAGGSELTFHSLIRHLTYWAVGCVRFCEQQRRQTLQLQAVRRGTRVENQGTPGVPQSSAKGGPLWGALFEERSQGDGAHVETGELGVGFYFINTCSVHWPCQALVSVLCKYLVWSSQNSYKADIISYYPTET